MERISKEKINLAFRFCVPLDSYMQLSKNPARAAKPSQSLYIMSNVEFRGWRRDTSFVLNSLEQ